MTVVHAVPAADSAVLGHNDRVVVAPAGRYLRMPPIHMDTDLAQPATIHALRDYLAAEVVDYRPVEVFALQDALICGQGAVVTRSGELLRESVLDFLAFGSIPDGFAATGNGYRMLPPVTRTIDAPCILAKRPWFRNFGHWIVDAAALLALTADTCRTEGLTIVVGEVGTNPLRKVMDDTIRLILPGSQVLFHPDDETWHFRSLRYVTPVHVPPLFKLPVGLSMLRDAILPDWSSIRSVNKILVVRGTGAHMRALHNSRQVYDLCLQRGYALVAPDLLPFAEAARLFASSRAVIGVKGAGLTNALFCRPGSAVMALSPADFPDPFFWDLVAQRGINYGEVFGTMTTERQQGHNDFVIEPERLLRLLDAAEESISGIPDD